MEENLEWSNTALGTRILVNKEFPTVRLGHVRNVGQKQWYVEYYSTNDSCIFTTLTEAKHWLEGKV